MSITDRKEAEYNRKIAARNQDSDRDRAVYNRKMSARNEHNGQEESCVQHEDGSTE